MNGTNQHFSASGSRADIARGGRLDIKTRFFKRFLAEQSFFDRATAISPETSITHRNQVGSSVVDGAGRGIGGRAQTLLTQLCRVLLRGIPGGRKACSTKRGTCAHSSSAGYSDPVTSERLAPYRVWGEDKVLYGPLDLATLQAWITAHRLTAGSWVFLEDRNLWQMAADVPELRSALAAQPPPRSPAPSHGAAGKPNPGFTSSALRLIKLFKDLEEPQLEAFSHYLEVVKCSQFSHIVCQGQPGDAMYLVLEGEVRALSIVEGKESPLATIAAGQWFGEISLLDHGPRSVDVIANKDSILLRLSTDSFKRLLREAPGLAIPFLLVLTRTLAERVRLTTKRFEHSIRFIRIAGNL